MESYVYDVLGNLTAKTARKNQTILFVAFGARKPFSQSQYRLSQLPPPQPQLATEVGSLLGLTEPFWNYRA